VVELQRGGWVPQNEQSSIAEMDRLRSRRHKEKTTERRLMTIAYTPREKCRRRTWTCSSTDSVSLRVETIFHVVYIHCKSGTTWKRVRCSVYHQSRIQTQAVANSATLSHISYRLNYDVKWSQEIWRLGGGIVLDLVGSRLEWVF